MIVQPPPTSAIMSLVVGWLVPLAIGIYYVYWLMPSALGIGVGGAYSELRKWVPWLLLWGLGWILVSGVVLILQARRVKAAPARRRAVAGLCWVVATVELGALIVAVPMSSALSKADFVGSYPASWLWLTGICIGLVALVAALVLAVSDTIASEGPSPFGR
ncbi:hypothetical protein GCM10009750_34970 [Agromyces salentinus]|uniref:DUF3180 domain-containing protein n=1 Tax=Agromyces salentinus TaxID=269421 RepID=A0ABN2N0U8_9MICO